MTQKSCMIQDFLENNHTFVLHSPNSTIWASNLIFIGFSSVIMYGKHHQDFYYLCRNRKIVTCSWLRLKSIPENIPADTAILNLRGNEIKEWTPQPHLHLLSLDLSFNEFSEFPVGLPNTLKTIWLQYNLISEIKPKQFGIHLLYLLFWILSGVARGDIAWSLWSQNFLEEW